MIFKRENYPINTVMHCKTEKEAEIFTDYLDKQGLRWASGHTYSVFGTKYEVNSDRTCYNYNTGCVSNIEWYIENGYNIIEFDDFEWDGYSNPDNTISVDNTDNSVLEKFLSIFRKGSENK